jgi:hypothetical protein
MTRFLKPVVAAAMIAAASIASATPSTTFWTPATIYTQPAGVPHITYDTYFSEQNAFQIDTGLEIGVLALPALQAEVGFDLFFPTFNFPAGTGTRFGTFDYAQVNGKLTLPEGVFGKWSPGVSVGVANVGFKEDVSDYHTVHGTVGKTTPIGLLGVGGYYGAGSKLLWTGSKGEERAGFMASWVSPDIKIGATGLDKIIFLADLATGNNWFGAVGGGIGLYFTPSIDLLTGPVFFMDSDLYKQVYGTDWLWTVQLDVDFDLRKPKK